MEVLRVELSKPLVFNGGYEGSVLSLLISKDIKECLKGLYNVEPNDYAIMNPFKMPTSIEIYNIKTKKIDLIVKRFFSEGRKVEIMKSDYTVVLSKKHSFLWNERLLKGYKNTRINKYKTINPIFLKKLFNDDVVLNEKIDIELFKELATKELLDNIAKRLDVSQSDLYLEWESFDITFAKCSLEEKNQICFFGLFKTNFVPPVFMGDYTQNSCGKIILLKDDSIKVKRAKGITLHFKEDFFNELKTVSQQNGLDMVSFVRNCIEEKINIKAR